MAQPYTRGPVHLYVKPGDASTPYYLGTGERAPRVSRRRQYAGVRNDLAGLMDFDVSYQGSECFVTVKLTRWNESVLLAIENAPSPNVALDATGTEVGGDIGRLMVTQGAAYEMWVQYSYAAGQLFPQAAFANAANGAMRVGYHFLAAFLDTEDNHEGGTDPATEAITFRCIRTYSPATGAFTLYNRDMTAIAGSIPN